MCRDCDMNAVIEDHCERVVHFESRHAGEGSFSMFAGCERDLAQMLQFCDERIHFTEINHAISDARHAYRQSQSAQTLAQYGLAHIVGAKPELPARLAGGVRPYRWTVNIPTGAVLAAVEKVLHEARKGEQGRVQSDSVFDALHRGRTESALHHFDAEGEYIGNRDQTEGAANTIVHLRPVTSNHSLRVVRQAIVDLAYPLVTPVNRQSDHAHAGYYARGINGSYSENVAPRTAA